MLAPSRTGIAEMPVKASTPPVPDDPPPEPDDPPPLLEAAGVAGAVVAVGVAFGVFEAGALVEGAVAGSAITNCG